ncbi:hypothetical protein HKD24_15175 [Gluconobacter sp. LMG 31484]|uniref:Uncharacterized protein n=1 Tax=Gluconobacter vitians TaxID=2728102 RepID=A0ABR9YAQ6_9PROT|nr:hypothetical protein [Gluconobacter vitians]MBF0860504.1 hypothetical protein [Gluconobacter vitians]
MTHGVLFVCGKVQHRRQVTLKKNPELVLLRNEFDPCDQRPDRFYRLCSADLVLEAVVERRDLLAIQLGHVGVQQGRWSRRIGQLCFDFCLAGFEFLHACLESRAGKTVEDRLHGLVEFALDFGQFRFQSDQIGPFFHPQTIRSR